MRFINIISAMVVLLGFSACEKREVATLNLDVSTTETNYKVGDTINFKISGNPDQLYFYSGETGHKYLYKDRTQAESNMVTLQFATNRRYGADAQQPNSLRLLASQTFNGAYTADNIKETTDWVDITSAFALSGIQGGDTYINSGVVNLTTLGSLGFNLDLTKPVFFAFKYNGVTGSTQPRWWINQFDINTTTTDGQVLPVTSIGNAAWTQVKVLPESPINWVFGTDNTVKFQGGGAAVLSNNVWAITKEIVLTSVLPDTGVPIKDIRDRLENFQYIFTTPGIYSIAFIGANINVYGESSAVKELTITVSN